MAVSFRPAIGEIVRHVPTGRVIVILDRCILSLPVPERIKSYRYVLSHLSEYQPANSYDLLHQEEQA